jgi:aryl carrier-like protein
MLPSSFVVLDALPLTSGGKLDRQALLQLAWPQTRPETGESPPRTELERALTRVWQEVLGINRVGIHDNFFDLGGHSLLMVKLHGRLKETLRQDLSMIDLFRNPTIHALAKAMGEEGAQHPSLRRAQERARKQRSEIVRRADRTEGKNRATE